MDVWYELMLARAQEIVDKLYQLTMTVNYTGEDEKEEDEVAAYVAMVEEREPLVQELNALRTGLSPADRATPEFADIMKCIADIADIDIAHRGYFEKLRDELRSTIKEMKSGRQISAAYNAEPVGARSLYLDKKN